MRNPRSVLIAVFFLSTVPATVHAQALGRDFDVFELEERVDIINEFCHAMKVNYSLWTLKASRTGMAPERICLDAVSKEAAIPDPSIDTFEQAKANLEFLDRMQWLQAQFQDSHLSLAPTVGRARIRMPFKVAEVEGKVVVVSVEKPLLALLSEEKDVTGISVGDEIVTVGGEPVSSAITKILPWIPNSSRLGARQHAVESLVDRAFGFPETPSLKLGIRKMPKVAAAGVAPEKPKQFEAHVPWVYDGVDRLDEREFFHRANYFNPVGPLTKTWDITKAEWVPIPGWTQGYSDATLAKKLKEPDFLFDSSLSPAAIAGVYDEDGKKAVVLQLRSFPDRVIGRRTRTPNGDDFAESVAALIAKLQKKNLPMIVDLRTNFGGILDQATEVARALIPEGTTVPGISMALPLTHLSRTMNEVVGQPEGFVSNENLPKGVIPEFTQANLNDLVKLAASTKSPLTSAFVSEDLEGTGDPTALANGVAVLISPDCVSACEILVKLVKSGGAVVLIGSETDGTGAGYVFGSAFDGSWKDHYSAFRGNFPTFLFGAPGDTVGKRVYPGQADAMCSEQKPTRADPGFEYKPTLADDILGGDKGWMRFAINALTPTITVKPKP